MAQPYRMSTIRQKRLAKAVVDNLTAKHPKNKKELLVSAGYSKISAAASTKDIFEQKGTQEELKKLGFDSDNAKRVVGEILDDAYAEPRDRLTAAKEIFKVNGDYAPEKHINRNINEEFTNRERELASRLLHGQRD